jgi:uncharacterized protein (DUF2235 family)
MKCLVICCDGTWQSLQKTANPTNIFKIAQAIKPVSPSKSQEIEQVVYYDHGVGSGDLTGQVDLGERISGGAFGKGIDHKIQDAYFFLCENYVSGDEVYLFGFSRGAYTVRSLAGMIHCSGLLSRSNLRKVPEAYELYRDRLIKPSDKEAQAFRQENGDRINITLLGCFDTVGSMGVPDEIPFLPFDKLINAKYRFYDTDLSSIIQNALHAVAIDEIRKVFDVTPMIKSQNAPNQVVKQVWFPGEHGCVGGGHEKHGLSDGALLWMVDEIKALGLGLEFDLGIIPGGVKPDPLEDFDNSLHGIYMLTGKHERLLVENAILHPSVQERGQDRQDYRPQNLVSHRKSFQFMQVENQISNIA